MSNQIRTICPSTLSVIFDEPGTSLKEAVKVAADSKKAFESYRTTSLEDRKQIVRRALDIFEQRRDELAKELTAQMGRPIRYCASEINTMRLRAEYLMDIAEESLCDLPGRPESGFRRTVKRVPVGPVLIVGAWNVSEQSYKVLRDLLIHIIVPLSDHRQCYRSSTSRW